MPASVTHAYFANDVYDILPKEIKDKLSISRLKMFGQSTDSFIFYKLFSFIGNKKIRKMQHTFHTEKTQDFFINLIIYIKKYNLSTDVDTCSFLCGFICHYVLDSTIHPYVFYKTGKFEKDKPSTYKYNNLHLFMETYLDNYLIKEREKENPYTFSIAKFCFDLKSFSKALNDSIKHSFKKTYNLDFADKIYYDSLKDMKLAMKVFRQDRFGTKRFIYKLVDTFTSKNCFRFEGVSYHYSMNTNFDFLNFNHHIWRNPTTYSLISHESFYDLYIKSLKLAKKLVESTFDYLNGKNIVLEQLYSNLSYVTGLDCNIKKELKYFEF